MNIDHITIHLENGEAIKAYVLDELELACVKELRKRPHKLDCDKYHAHHAPECCASDCWCHELRERGVE